MLGYRLHLSLYMCSFLDWQSYVGIQATSLSVYMIFSWLAELCWDTGYIFLCICALLWAGRVMLGYRLHLYLYMCSSLSWQSYVGIQATSFFVYVLFSGLAELCWNTSYIFLCICALLWLYVVDPHK